MASVAKLLKDLPRDWELVVLEHYYKGASDQEVAMELGIAMTTFNKLYRQDDAFHEIVDDGRGLSMAWWYKQGRENLHNKSFNYTGWFQNMKNRYGWADKAEISDGANKPMEQKTDEELRKEVEQMLAKAGFQNT